MKKMNQSIEDRNRFWSVTSNENLFVKSEKPDGDKPTDTPPPPKIN
jgi:hypothetical protein